MKTKQLGILAIGFGIAGLLFLTLDHTKDTEALTPIAQTVKAIDQNAEVKEKVIQEALSSLPNNIKDSVSIWFDKTEYMKVAQVFEKNEHYDAAALNYALVSKGLKEEQGLLFIGRKLISLLTFLKYQGVKAQISSQALEIYSGLVNKHPNNNDFLFGMAIVKVDGEGDVMTGVSILKKILETEPKHYNANFHLGRLGIMSQQFDKAISRLEVVIEQDPNDIKALLFVSEAYLGKGNKQEAIKYLKQVSMLTTSIEMRSQIENYIKELSN